MFCIAIVVVIVQHTWLLALFEHDLGSISRSRHNWARLKGPSFLIYLTLYDFQISFDRKDGIKGDQARSRGGGPGQCGV